MRSRLDNRREAETYPVTHVTLDGVAQDFILTLGRFPDGRLAEVFVDVPFRSGKSAGSLSTLVAKDVALLISIALQHGATIDELADGMGRGEVNWMGNVEERPHTMIGTILGTLAEAERSRENPVKSDVETSGAA